MNRIEFDTIEFEMSHGKTPRGRGSWAFATSRTARIEDVWFTPGGMTYAEAKKAARARFANVGTCEGTLYVLP